MPKGARAQTCGFVDRIKRFSGDGDCGDRRRI